MIYFDRPESGFNSLVCIEARLVNEVVQALTVEHSFHLWKHSLDWLEFGTVPDVPYRLHVQLRPLLFDTRLFVDGRIVHEQWDWSFSYFPSQLNEVVAKVFACARVFMNLDQSNPTFFRHGSDHWTETNVDIFLIHSQVRIFLRPLSEFDCSLRKKYLVDVDYQATFLFGLFNVLNQTSAFLNEVLPRFLRHDLFLPHLFASDPML